MKEFARKYRPKSLKDIIGQPEAVRILQQAYNRKALSHKYLLTGPPWYWKDNHSTDYRQDGWLRPTMGYNRNQRCLSTRN